MKDILKFFKEKEDVEIVKNKSYYILTDNFKVLLVKEENKTLQKYKKLDRWNSTSKITTKQIIVDQAGNDVFVITGDENGRVVLRSAKNKTNRGIVYNESSIVKIIKDSDDWKSFFIMHANGTVILTSCLSLRDSFEFFKVKKMSLDQEEIADVLLYKTFTDDLGEPNNTRMIISTSTDYMLSVYRLNLDVTGSRTLSATKSLTSFISSWIPLTHRKTQYINNAEERIFKTNIERLWNIKRDGSRKIVHMEIDGENKYMVLCDTIGRVLLIDLMIKLITKIWKGYRMTTCKFTKVHGETVLLIFSRNRHSIEFWNPATETKMKELSLSETTFPILGGDEVVLVDTHTGKFVYIDINEYIKKKTL